MLIYYSSNICLGMIGMHGNINLFKGYKEILRIKVTEKVQIY